MDQNQPTRSRSNTSKSTVPQRPASQGSTTSLQSVDVGTGFQPQPDQQLAQQSNVIYSHPDQQQMHHAYSHAPNDAMLHHYPPHPSVEHPMQHTMRPMSQQEYAELHRYPVQYGEAVPQYAMQHPGINQQHLQHMRHQSEQYTEGSPAPDDSSNELGGAKRRKGTASSLANDQELRRLLVQYHGKTLKEVAAEVQRNEGSGGKSEKAKQVFAMLWLRENCRRSNSSVRRDRVFCRYTERCGNERVPTLNPASFGKLVRIIFPNVQTRRLGVRGESKYHYVDLSLYPDDGESRHHVQAQQASIDDWARPERGQRPSSIDQGNKAFQSHTSRPSVSEQTMRPSLDTADFPAPSSRFLSRPVDGPAETETKFPKNESVNLDCQYLNTPIIRISQSGMSKSLIAALPSVRAGLPASLPTYMAMPEQNSQILVHDQTMESPLQLPDIHSYLSHTNYDTSIADSLSNLYRSYCIDVIDSFRKCKEKPFFNHHSAFNGKMTVPVAKLFSLEVLSPWIHECDMRMYKQMIRVVAPLCLQEVPPQVWAVFDRVSVKLVPHLVTAFEEKCPLHVLTAKVVPAARFANVLRKLKGANTAAMHIAGMLLEPNVRTQMWLDLLTMVNPDDVVDESAPPPEALSAVEGILSIDIKGLVNSAKDATVDAAEQDPTSSFSNFMLQHIDSAGILPLASANFSGALDRWVQWLDNLSLPFSGHHPQCVVNWHTRFWKSIMTQLGIGGAQSYQAWWYLEAFLTNMLDCLTQVGGMLMEESSQKTVEQQEQKKRQQLDNRRRQRRGSSATSDVDETQEKKRKRGDDEDFDVGPGPKRAASEESVTINQSANNGDDAQQTSEEHNTNGKGTQSKSTTATGINLDGGAADQLTHGDSHLSIEDDDSDDEEMAQIRQSGPVDLPSINLTSSPLKRLLLSQTPIKLTPRPASSKNRYSPGLNAFADDSGIDLGLDLEQPGRSPSKLNSDDALRKMRRELGLWSDPADGDVVVV